MQTIIAFCAFISFTFCAVPSQINYDQLSNDLSCGFVITRNESNFTEYASGTFITWDDINIPSAIIMCQCEDDVIITMKWIENHLDSTTFRLRSGGHSFGGYSKALDSILIDLSSMKNIDIIRPNNRISIEPGINLKEFEEWKCSNPYFDGTLPHGLCVDVAFGGYATGGGIGLTTRKWGVLSDYIYGVRVILCDGSLWEIIENKPSSTKCIKQCSTNIALNNDDLQNLLYAIKGGGGGNFGIITKYYFNTISDPQYPMYFNLIFSLSTRYNIYDSIKTFKNILIDDFNKNDDFGIYLLIAPALNNENNDFPYNFQIQFVCIYLSPNDDNIIFYEIINKIEQYMELSYIESLSVISTSMSLNEIYKDNIFPMLAGSGFDLNGYPSTRLMYKHSFADDYMNTLTDYLYENIIINPLLESGIINPFFLEALGGKIHINNKKTSFPVQNRKALAVSESFFIVPPQTPIAYVSILQNLAKSLRDKFDLEIMSLFGDYKYNNYLDDINNDLTQYYSTNEIDKLSAIQQVIDPNSCFKFELGINGGVIPKKLKCDTNYDKMDDVISFMIELGYDIDSDYGDYGVLTTRLSHLSGRDIILFRGCTPFDSTTNIATTGDLESYSDLVDAFKNAQLSIDCLNLDSIPKEAVNNGKLYVFRGPIDDDYRPRNPIDINLRNDQSQ